MPPQGIIRQEDENFPMEPSAEMTKANVPLVELELENVTYAPIAATAGKKRAADNHKERKIVLNNVSTKLSPYVLTAIMGPSGSGKTSTLSVAAGLVGDLLDSSTIKINGSEGSVPKKLVGVVWQDDLMMSNLTVEETVYFAARLKTSSSTSDQEVRKIVEETLEELGIMHIRDSLIGGPNRKSISGGERKRVSVASELTTRPSLLLLDEPTSGLDSTSSFLLMKTLKDLAGRGHTIAAVIHQPRTEIFGLLDHLLLLSQGRVVFDGVPCTARAHFESCPSIKALPPETGIADWLMDIIKEDEQGQKVLPKLWEERKPTDEQVLASTRTSDKEARTQRFAERQMSSLAELHSIPKYETSFWTQLVLLSKRAMKQNRGEKITKTSLVLAFAYTVFTALIWWRIPNDVGHVYDRNSILFFMLIAQSNGIVTSSVTIFQQERALLQRERAKKMYGVLPYFLAKTASDMTNNVLLPCVYGAITYWTANLRPTGTAYMKFLFAFYWTLSTAQSMGTALSVLIPHTQISLLIAPAVTLFFMIMGGFYVPFENLNPVIRWASWLSFARYGYSAFLVNEYEGRDVPCSDEEVSISIGDASDCPQPGDDILSSLGIEGVTSNYWFNLGIVIALQVFFRTAAYAVLRRRR